MSIKKTRGGKKNAFNDFDGSGRGLRRVELDGDHHDPKGVEQMTIRELCEKYGMGQTALARRFEIPLRTVQDWYSGRSTPPVYVVKMLDRLLNIEQE